jgi:hypothetical protein
MKQYRVYLTAELGKLRHVGAAADFINAVGPAALAELGLPPKPEDLSARLSDHDSVVAFVGSLSDDSLVSLVEACDARWRRNGVSATLRLGSGWAIRSVDIGSVDVQQAEPSLGDFFRSHRSRLVDIAADARLLEHCPYSGWTKGEAVPYPVVLGLNRGGRMRLFDGIHRAIQLAINGETTVQVCSPDEEFPG